MTASYRMKITRIISLLVFIALFAACTQTPTKSEFSENVNFPKLKNYVWGNNTISMQKTGKTVDRLVEDIGVTVRDDLPQLINQELTARGYKLTENEKPDFIVQYSAKSKVESMMTRETNAPNSAATATKIGQAGTIQLGTLTVFLLEPGTFKLLWRGQTDTIIKFDGKTKNRLSRVVKKMFKDFPQQQAKQETK